MKRREGLSEFATGLYERYEMDGGIQNELLLELALVDYWRHSRALNAETTQFSLGCVSNPEISVTIIPIDPKRANSQCV